ncbi:MAG: 2Fe-2S iron-sulfur cluster-binding protein [Mesorhizobium sp.]
MEAAEEAPLMHSLRDAGLPVTGTCGGHAACGSCHVYVERQWLGKLPPKDDPEAEMLDLLEAIDSDRSRLACQIRMRPISMGLSLNWPRKKAEINAGRGMAPRYACPTGIAGLAFIDAGLNREAAYPIGSVSSGPEMPNDGPARQSRIAPKSPNRYICIICNNICYWQNKDSLQPSPWSAKADPT